MIGNNTIVLCIAEAHRLLELALQQEGFVKGKFKVTSVSVVNKNNHYDAIEVRVQGEGDDTKA